MQEIINNLRELWDLPFARDVLLVGVTVGLTHFWDIRKYKKERRDKHQDQIGERISAALTAARDIAISTRTIEMHHYSLEDIQTENAGSDQDVLYYPAFLTNTDTLMEFVSKVTDARKSHEPYLDLMSAAYLYVLERYLRNIALYVAQYQYQDELDTLGLALIVDVQKWERNFDTHLVRRMNHPHYRLFSRHGWIWSKAKRYVENKYLLNSELDKMIKISAEMEGDETNA